MTEIQSELTWLREIKAAFDRVDSRRKAEEAEKYWAHILSFKAYDTGSEITVDIDGVPMKATVVSWDPYAYGFWVDLGDRRYRFIKKSQVIERKGDFYKCTCGAEKTNQPGHSNWCDKETI